MRGTDRGEDGVRRCSWGASDRLYVPHHDREWDFPVADDRRLADLSFADFGLGTARERLSGGPRRP